MVIRLQRSFGSSRKLLLISVSALLIISGLGLSGSPPVGKTEAASYSFSVSSESVNVTVQRDGSVDIDYHFVFTNVNNLNGVDIGLPNSNYNGSSTIAWIVVGSTNYVPEQVHASPYVNPGIAVEFGSSLQNKIQNHGSFELYFHINNPHMVYINDQVADTVGVSFRPTWFDPSAQNGPTGILTECFIFPIGFDNATQAYWLQNHPWNSLTFNNATGRAVATWTSTNVYPDAVAGGAYDFGGGFPTVYVEQYYQPVKASIVDDIITLLGLLAPLIFFAFIVVVILLASISQARRRNGDYYEPKMNVVGAGPRCDFTAVEASVILERPLENVATMILFGLIKKGKVQIVSEPAPMHLKKLAETADYPYENDYLKAILPDQTVGRAALKNTLVHLIESTRDKMKGFDLVVTKMYYETISDKAWQQVKEAGTPEDMGRLLNEKNDWIMLDQDYPGRMQNQILVLPILIGRPHGPTGGAGLDVGQAASNYVSQVRSAASNPVNDMRGISHDVVAVTNPVPIAPASGQGMSGGGHCACACAGGGR